MKSSIKIDFEDTGKGLQPIILIKAEESEDVRDALLKTFFQSLGGESSWLSVKYGPHGFGESKYDIITIYPITPQELEETIEIIKNRIYKKI